MPTGVATAIIDRTIEVMDTIARIGTIAAMDIIAHIGHTIGAMDIARTDRGYGGPAFYLAIPPVRIAIGGGYW